MSYHALYMHYFIFFSHLIPLLQTDVTSQHPHHILLLPSRLYSLPFVTQSSPLPLSVVKLRFMHQTIVSFSTKSTAMKVVDQMEESLNSKDLESLVS